MAKIKVLELRAQSKDELLIQLKELKAELTLRTAAEVSGGAPNNVFEIRC